MAIYHLRHGLISRSSGRSAVQSVSYITGTDLHESRRNLKIAYKNRHSDIAFTDTLAPEHTPESFKNVAVWDILENFEDDKVIFGAIDGDKIVGTLGLRREERPKTAHKAQF